MLLGALLLRLLVGFLDWCMRRMWPVDVGDLRLWLRRLLDGGWEDAVYAGLALGLALGARGEGR